MTPLHRAVQGGHIEVVILLLDRGASVDATNKVGGVSTGGVVSACWIVGCTANPLTHMRMRFSWYPTTHLPLPRPPPAAVPLRVFCL